MDDFHGLSKEYFESLEKRRAQSRAYRSYQFIGLELAALLRDMEHKALYIKIAKEHTDHDRLITLAKDIVERKNIRNRGAYFMKLFFNDKK